MTRIVFERDLPMPVEAAWDLVTDPVAMNRWSVAPIEVPTGSDPQRRGGRRVVRVRHLGVPLGLVEEAVEVEAPHRYAYVVRPNVVVRRHHAVQTLTPAGDGTHLRWEVEMHAWIPGLMWLLIKSMRHQLEKSLDRMVVVAAGGGAT